MTRSYSFAELGGDSLSALSCSLLLEEIFGVEVPASVINNPAGNLQQLATYIERARDGTSSVRPLRPCMAAVPTRSAPVTSPSTSSSIPETLDDARAAMRPSSEIRTVLVTGANGYLGHFLCLEWLERMAKVGGKVICVARGQDSAAARQRIASAFDSGDAELTNHFEQLAGSHLEVLAGDLSEVELGLSHATGNGLPRAWT